MAGRPADRTPGREQRPRALHGGCIRAPVRGRLSGCTPISARPGLGARARGAQVLGDRGRTREPGVSGT